MKVYKTRTSYELESSQSKWFISHKVCKREPLKSNTKLGYWYLNTKNNTKKEGTKQVTIKHPHKIKGAACHQKLISKLHRKYLYF